MSRKIGITTTSFGKISQEPLKLVQQKGFKVINNNLGRPLRKEEICNILADCEGVIAGTENYDAEVMKNLPDLKIISRCGAGIDNIDMVTAENRGIKIYNTPEGPTQAVAELVVGLILNLLRKISLMDRNLHKGIWEKKMGSLFQGKKVGIIGFGRIGKAVAQLSNAMGGDTFYYDAYLKQLNILNTKRVELNDLLKAVDIVTMHVPFNQETLGLIGEKEFSLVGEGTFFINCSRGGVVNERALYSALKNGKLAGAAIDVFESEPYRGDLQGLDNVILTPHIGSYAKEARVQMEIEAVNNLIAGFMETEETEL